MRQASAGRAQNQPHRAAHCPPREAPRSWRPGGGSLQRARRPSALAEKPVTEGSSDIEVRLSTSRANRAAATPPINGPQPGRAARAVSSREQGARVALPPVDPETAHFSGCRF